MLGTWATQKATRKRGSLVGTDCHKTHVNKGDLVAEANGNWTSGPPVNFRHQDSNLAPEVQVFLRYLDSDS